MEPRYLGPIGLTTVCSVVWGETMCVCGRGGGWVSVGMHVHVVWCDVLCNMEWASINGYLGVFHCMVHRCNHIEQMKHVLPTNVSQQWHAFMFFGSHSACQIDMTY